MPGPTIDALVKLEEKWLKQVGRYRVEHIPLPYFDGPVDLEAPRKGVLHTTQGSSVEGALSAYRSQKFTPTFTLGRDIRGRVRILQHKPLGKMGSTMRNRAGGVETNRLAIAQVELVAFSRRRLWRPDDAVLDALAALVARLNEFAGIPLRHVPAARDPRRWKRSAGWFGHIDVPENDHWDPGEFDWERLLNRAARHRLGLPETKGKPPATRPSRLDHIRTGPLRRRAGREIPSADCAIEAH